MGGELTHALKEVISWEGMHSWQKCREAVEMTMEGLELKVVNLAGKALAGTWKWTPIS